MRMLNQVLMIGIGYGNWSMVKSMVPARSGFILNIEDVFGKLAQLFYADLELVWIEDELRRPRELLLSNCEALAKVLASHQKRPLVALSNKLDYLKEVFVRNGVVVVDGDLAHAVEAARLLRDKD